MIVLLGLLSISALSITNKGKNNSDDILGYWVVEKWDSDGTVTYRKVRIIPADSPGLEFIAGGELQDKKNSGWCGTPPISYGFFKGNWEISEKNILSLKSRYWGGSESSRFKIIELTKKEMVLELIDSEMDEPFFL